MAAPQKYAHIDFTPPAGARKEAEQGLKLRREHGRGGTAVGIARARDIANGVKLSPSTVRRMKAFFDRHASDSKAEGFRRGEKGWPSNGVIANKLWGGPAGYAWAKKVVAQMEAADARSTYSLDAETSTIEAGTDRRSAVIPNVERRFLGNFSETEASDPDLLKIEERADPATGKKQTYLVGYAARFGKNSLLLGDFVERIAPTAFQLVESRKDGDGKPLETRCLFNHSPDNLLGRFPTTMRMWVDEQGLRYECLLPETRKDIAELVARGDLKGSSFSFIVADGGEKWSSEEGRSIRLVTKIKSLLDCGPVTYPAYDSATVAVAKRSYDQFVASKSPMSVVEKRDSGIAARAAKEARKTQEFLADRRAFCPTGPGGGVDNSCGKSNPGVTEATQSKMAKGAVIGAKVGAVTTGNVIGGALAGAVIGSFLKEESAALDKQYHFTGLSKEKVSAAAKIIGNDVHVSPDYEGVTLKSKNVEVKVEHGDEWQEAGQTAKGTNAHFLFNRKEGADAKPSDIKDIIKTGKALGVNHVSVAVSADDKATIAKFEAKGFKVVRAEKGSAAILSKEIKGYDKSQKPGEYRPKEQKKGFAEKVLDYSVLAHAASDVIKAGVKAKTIASLPKLAAKTLKTVDATFEKVPKKRMDELHAFLAERRAFCATGPGGGIDNSCGAGGAKGQPADDVGVHVSHDYGTAKEVANAIGGGINAGLLAGAGAAAAGPPGAVVGAALGFAGTVYTHAVMAADAGKKVYAAIKKIGTSESKLDEAARTLDVHMTVSAGKNGSVVAESNSGFKIEFQKYAKDEVGDKNAGLYAHVENPDRAIGGKGAESTGRLASTLVKAARQAGANHVTVKVDKGDPQTADQFEKSGYTAINAGSHWMMYRKVGASKSRSCDELYAFLVERRGFCPTGEGGGIDNSCNAGGGGSTGPKGGGGEKYKKSDDEDTDWLGRKTDKGPNWLGNDPKKTMEKIAESGGKLDDQLSGFKVHPKMGYDSGKKSGDYKEWKKGDHLDKSKEKDAQDFLDKARADQLARGGKDGGKSDDGGGVQTWSKGDHFPWTTKQVGTDKGYIQGQHPDGSKTAKYQFEGDPSEAHKKVIEEIKSKKKGKRSVTLSEMKAFFMERAG